MMAAEEVRASQQEVPVWFKVGLSDNERLFGPVGHGEGDGR